MSSRDAASEGARTFPAAGAEGDLPVARLPVTVVGPSRTLADAVGERQPAFGRTLRFALAMRGGVSLAVWIGGAVAELDVLRRIRIHRDAGGVLHAYLLHPSPIPDPRLEDRAGVYARLLADAGYDRVEFDILAGASAGGINSVVHAVAQRAGTGLDPLARLWGEHAAVTRMLRPLGRRPVDSVLQGDSYLWPGLQEVLGSVHTSAEHHPDLVAEHVTVELSATVLDSDSSADHATAEGRAGFHFAAPEPGTPGPPPGNDIPARRGPPAPDGTAGDDASEAPADDDGRAAALSRLAYAARASSSFPGAFEPASVWSAPTDGKLRAFPRPDLSHAFSAHRDPALLPYRVVDGGVFDNIPIDRALTAARTRTSLRHADRCLLYLDPDPPAAQEPRSPDPELDGFARTLGATASRLLRRETEDSEVLALADHLDAQLLAHGRLHPLAALAGSWDPASLEERRRAYVRYRARADAALLDRLLTRPAEWQLTSTLRRRRQVRARRPEELGPLREELVLRYEALSRGALQDPAATEVLRGPQALVDAASCVLSWVRFLETLTLGPGPAPAPLAGFDPAPARACAYRLLAVAGHARDRRFWDVLAACTDPAAPVTDGVAAWMAATPPLKDPAPGTDPVLSAPGPAPSTLDGRWSELDAVVERLRAAHRAVEDALDGRCRPGGTAAATEDAPDWRKTWCESPWHTVPGAGPPLAAADLPPVFSAAGIPAPLSRIVYGEIRGDRPPAEAEAFGELRRWWADERLQRALAAEDDSPAELRRLLAVEEHGLRGPDKLAGTGLLNFRGFLATQWRRNDWWWGRLDAAAGTAAFLRELARRSPAPPRTEEDEQDTADAAAALQENLLQDLGGGSAERGRAAASAGADRLDRLVPAYRLSLASRGLRVLARALAGTPGLPRGLRETALLLLQPLLVVAPLAVTPVRAAHAAVIATAGLWLATGPAGGAPGGAPWTVARVLLVALVAVALVLSLLRTGLRARHRWAVVRQAAGISPPAGNGPSPGEVVAARDRALLRTALAGAAALSALVGFAAAVHSGHAAVAAVLVLAASGLDRLAAALAVRVPGRSPVDGTARACLVVLAAAAVWAGVLVVRAPDAAPASGTGRAAALALTLLVVGLLVLVGWVRTGWAALLAPAAAVLGGAVAWLVWAWAGGPGRPGADAPALIAAVIVWAAVLWWGPGERMLRGFGPDRELLPRRERASPGIRTAR